MSPSIPEPSGDLPPFDPASRSGDDAPTLPTLPVGDAAPSTVSGLSPSAQKFEDFVLGQPSSYTRPGSNTPPPPAQFVPAVAVPGFEILGELGRGGMGVVYKARQTLLDRPVALKLVLSVEQPSAVARFLVEARAIGAIDHPHVVRVYESGEVGERPYLAMEFVDGGSLSDRLKTGGRYHTREAAELVAKIARGVQAAHDEGIIHRDLKPPNILLDTDGEPKVCDFGLARLDGGAELTHSNAVMGTPSWMSPEQARGETGKVGRAADIWALGVILYECLTGTLPFRGESGLVIMRQVTDADPDSLRSHSPGLPRDLDLICMKCLAKKPGDRYPSAAALADDLECWLERKPVSVRPAGLTERAIKWVQRNPGGARLIGLGVLASVVIVGLGLKYRWDIREKAAENKLAEVEGRNARNLAEAEVRNARNAETTQKFLRLLTQAKNLRIAARAGWTWAVRKDLDEAAALEHDKAFDADLRDEYVAASMALDARQVTSWPLEIRGYDGQHLRSHPTRPILVVSEFGFETTITGFRMQLYLLDTRTGKIVTTLKIPVDPLKLKPGGRKESLSGIAFSPDGRWLVATVRSGRMFRWDVSQPIPGPIQTWPETVHDTPLVFSPDGRLFYSGGENTLRVWDTTTWDKLAQRKLGNEFVSVLPVAGMGRVLAGFDRHLLTLDSWDLTELMPHLPTPGITSTGASLVGRNSLLAEGNRIAVLDPLTTSRVGSIDFKSLPGEGRMRPGLSPDGRYAAVTQSATSTLTLLDYRTGKRVCNLPIADRESDPPFSFSPDGRRLFVGGRNEIRVYELAEGGGREAVQPEIFRRFMSEPGTGTLFASSAREPGIQMFPLQVSVWSAEDKLAGPRFRRLLDVGNAVDPIGKMVRQSPGTWLSGGAPDGGFAWNLADDDYARFENPKFDYLRTGVAFGPSGNLWLGSTKAVEYDLPSLKATGAEFADPLAVVFKGHGVAQHMLGGKTGLMCGDISGGFTWIDPKGKKMAEWKSGNGPMSAADLTPDDTFALIGLASGQVKIVRPALGKTVASWQAHTDAVNAVRWLGPRLFATGSEDRSLSVWQWDGYGEPRRIFSLPTQTPLRDLAAVPGGLAILEEDNRAIRVLDLKAVAATFRERGIGDFDPVELPPPNAPFTAFWEKEPPAPVNGLRADYFTMADGYREPLLYLLTRVEADLGQGWKEGKPHTSIPAQWWIAQYRGWLKAPKPGKYTLIVDADAEAKVFLDGKLLGPPLIRGHGEIALELGDKPHRLRIDYRQEAGKAGLKVRWAQAGGFAARPLGASIFADRKAAE